MVAPTQDLEDLSAIVHVMRWVRWILAVAALAAGLLVAWLGDASNPRTDRLDRRWSGAAPVMFDGSTVERNGHRAVDGEPVRRSRVVPIGVRATPSFLATQRDWVGALNVYWALPDLESVARRTSHLRRAWSQVDNPVARQNLIFLIVLTVPFDRAAPWLREIAAEGSPADAEDVTVALAFSGDPDARARFLGLARSPERVNAHRLVNYFSDAALIAAEGTPEARAFLRSYRAIEVLDRDPYFDDIVVHAHWEWLPHPGSPDALTAELLPAWLARYPGHPGSDDMALRLGAHFAGQHRWPDALLWYSRATVLPDQRVTTRAMEELVRIAECECMPAELDRVASAMGFASPNRQLLQYIRVRRLAAEHDLHEGLRVAAAIAADEPQSAIGIAWANRWSAKLPRGLDSGVVPLPTDDPLRTREELRATIEPAPVPYRRLNGHMHLARERTPEQRLQPFAEPLPLDPVRLARQFRLWETLSELDRRAMRARQRDDRSDLQYKAAALLYHDRDAFFPLYLRHHLTTTWMMDGFRRESLGEQREGRAIPQWAQRHVAYLLALERFRAIARENPGYAGADKVLYSQGILLKRLMHYHPLDGVGPGEAERARQVIRVFEQLAATQPRSPLAAPAMRAVRYWNRQRQKRDG